MEKEWDDLCAGVTKWVYFTQLYSLPSLNGESPDLSYK